MRKLTLLSTLAVAVLVLGLSMNRPAAAEQSTVEPGTVSSDVSQATPSSLALDSEDIDSDLDLKRGRIGGGRGGGHLGRSVGHHGPRTHARIAHHSGHRGHHPGHRIHHRGHHRHHLAHLRHHPRHHHRLPLGAVSWIEPEVEIEETECIGCPTVTRPICQVVEPEVEIGGTECTQCPTRTRPVCQVCEPEVEIRRTECTQCPTRTRPVCQVCDPRETEVETEELEQDPEE